MKTEKVFASLKIETILIRKLKYSQFYSGFLTCFNIRNEILHPPNGTQCLTLHCLLLFLYFPHTKQPRSNWENNIRQYRQKYHLIQLKYELSEKENLYLLRFSKNGRSCGIIWMPTELFVFFCCCYCSLFFLFLAWFGLSCLISWCLVRDIKYPRYIMKCILDYLDCNK